MSRMTMKQAEQAMERGSEFRSASSLRGEYHPNGLRIPIGKLPVKWARELSRVDGRVYVIASYGTPIGWRTDSGEHVVPNVKYSTTTTRHQNMTRRAWSM